ncbi:Lethal(2) giant larvae [Lecanosticta acicola]|uniref:Lethal(2) giant larvae n=1 Tax=Lecanosticta acicola TaxID=111012 RepID=A0AAI9E8G2_9PEZI|nr:Lethal(2) giant larvae [Lecanosticta acicola]
MLPTPSTSHVNYDHIYEPSEDSYLLLDTLSSATETNFLKSRFSPESTCPLILEVGTGSGVVLAFAAANAQHIFGRRDIATLGSDVNLFACTATSQTVKLAIAANKDVCGSMLDVISGDLTSPLRQALVDMVIFNPPYVPTESLPSTGCPISTSDFERDSHLLSLSYAGGQDGMETTNRLLDQLASILSRRGVAYILLCAQNKPDEIVRQWQQTEGWTAARVGESGKKAGWEKLCIVKIWRER